MMNTKFRSTNAGKIDRMTKLWAQIFAVMLNIGRPVLPTTVWLNDNFEDIFEELKDETEVYKFIFDVQKVHYIDLNKEN